MTTPLQRAIKVRIGFPVLALIVALTGANSAFAQLPKRDLTIELRQIEEGRAEGQRYSAGPADASRTWEPQMLQVRNGEKATLRMQDTIPMTWVQSAGAETSQRGGQGGGTSSGQARTTAAGVSMGLVWFDAGQSVSLRPQWPGGNRPAQLEIEVQKAAVADRVGADLPTQSRNTVSTTVTAPLAQWVTIAASGTPSQAGAYSSDSAQQVRRLLQVRVMVP